MYVILRFQIITSEYSNISNFFFNNKYGLIQLTQKLIVKEITLGQPRLADRD